MILYLFFIVYQTIFLYIGDSCSEDQDGCADSPCSPVQTCTDLLPDETMKLGRGFNCSKCPEGYTNDNAICIGLLKFKSHKIIGTFIFRPLRYCHRRLYFVFIQLLSIGLNGGLNEIKKTSVCFVNKSNPSTYYGC